MNFKTLFSEVNIYHSRMRYFPRFQESSKILCAFLRNRQYKEAILHYLDDTGRHDLKIHFMKFSANFAKWRFGTMHRVCRQQKDIDEPIHQVEVPRMVKVKPSEMAEVTDVVDSDRHWGFNVLCGMICSEIAGVRGRFIGCICHPRECYEYALKGKVFPCQKKGETGPILREELEIRLHRWQQMLTLPVQDLRCHPDDVQDFRAAITQMIGMHKLKYGFLWLVPWVIWQCRKPGGAREYLNRYAKALESPNADRLPPLAHKFGSPEFLGNDMEIWAARGEMSEILDEEMTCYERHPCDEARAEGVHRHYKLMKTRGHNNQQFAATASDVLLEQNLRDYDECVAAGMADKFHQAFLNYKTIMQLKKSLRSHLQAKRTTYTNFVQWLFRLGKFAFVHWDCLAIKGLGPRPFNKFCGKDEISLIQIDFWKCLLKTGEFYSRPALPMLTNGNGSVTQEEAVPADSSADEARVHLSVRYQFFSVTDLNPGGKTLLYDLDMNYARFPIMMQSYEGWGECPAHTSSPLAQVVTLVVIICQLLIYL